VRIMTMPRFFLTYSFAFTSSFVLFFPNPSIVTAWTLADRLSGRIPWSSLDLRTRRRPNADHRRHHQPLSAAASSSNSGRNSGRDAPGSTKQENEKMLRFMNRPMETTVGDFYFTKMRTNGYVDPGENINTIDDDDDDRDVQDLVRCIVRAADGRKADDIVALHVAPITTLTRYLVILSGNSRPQNQAIAAAIQKDVQAQFEGDALKPGQTGVPEGSAESGWMLLDYGSVMVHIMTPKSRLYYNVEGQWKEKGGTYMDISDCLIPNRLTTEPAGAESSSASLSFTVKELRDGQVSPEDDPFWS